jgi:hypothetical protein
VSRITLFAGAASKLNRIFNEASITSAANMGLMLVIIIRHITGSALAHA